MSFFCSRFFRLINLTEQDDAIGIHRSQCCPHLVLYRSNADDILHRVVDFRKIMEPLMQTNSRQPAVSVVAA